MKILSRISIEPSVEEYPYKAPYKIRHEARLLLQQISQYCIEEDLKLLLLPIDSEEYRWVKAFIAKNKRYFTADMELFERKFSKSEIDYADFLVLRVANIVYSSSEYDNFDYCCEDRCFGIGMNSNMRIESRSMKNKDLGFATDYRFVISERMKELLENNQISNIDYIPVFQKKKDIIVAYQIEPKIVLPPLAVANEWEIYKSCKKSEHHIYDSNYKNQMLIPKSVSTYLMDFNASIEMFSELGAHEYIISKKMYTILKDAGVRALKCEPVRIE